MGVRRRSLAARRSSTPPPSGPPTTTTPGDFEERTYTSTTALTLTATAVGDMSAAGANDSAIASAINGTTGTDPCLTLAPPVTSGHVYYYSGSLDQSTYAHNGVTETYGRTQVPAKTGRTSLTIKGINGTPVLMATHDNRHSWFISQANVHMRNLVLRVIPRYVDRDFQEERGAGGIFVRAVATGFSAQDVIVDGARNAPWFFQSASGFKMNRCESWNGGADAWHIADNANNFQMYDCRSYASGDDLIGLVSYGQPESQGVRNGTIARFRGSGQTHGRGFGLIHCKAINFYGPTLLEDTSAAGIIVAREPQYATGGTAGSTRDINFYGEVRLRRCNHNVEPHGSILFDNPEATYPITGVTWHGPVVITDTQFGRSSQDYWIRAQQAGGSTVQASLTDVSFYGSGPAPKLSTSGTPQITQVGWSSSTATQPGSSEPAFAGSTVPAVPTGLTGAPGAGIVTWTWDAVAGATVYELSFGGNRRWVTATGTSYVQTATGTVVARVRARSTISSHWSASVTSGATAGAATSVTAAFGNANGTSLNGLSTDTGSKTWTVHTGAIDVQSGRARVTNQGDPATKATIDTGKAGDFDVQARLYGRAGANYPNMFAAYADSGNHYFLETISSTDLKLNKVVGGVVTAILQWTAATVDGDLLRMARVGSTITVYVNGVQSQQFTGQSDLATATRAGIGGAAYDATVKIEFDDFAVSIPSAGAANTAGTPLLRTAGTQLVRTDNSNPVILAGVNFMYHEHKGSTTTISSLIGKMRNDWGGNCVMVGYATRGVNLNLAHPYTGTAYLTLLDQIVAAAKANGSYVVFAPRWGGIEGRTTDGGSPTNTQFIGVPPTSGNDSASGSLATLATRYAAEPGVMFATQVEPNGTIAAADYRTYAQACVTAVRNTGSQAVVMAAGLDWGRDLSIYVGNALTGGNVAYKTHVYNDQTTWQTNFKGIVDAGLPLFVGEFGAPFNEGGTAVMTEADVEALLTYIGGTRKIGWTAWGFEEETSPRLTTDDSSAKPLGTLGAKVRTQMWKTPPVAGDDYRTSSPPAYPAETQLLRGTTVSATSGTATTLTDSDWSNGEWRSSGYPATVTFTGLASARTVAYAHSSGNYIADSNVTGGETYNEMGAYVIETSADGVTWTQRKSVTGNTRRSRTHTFDMGGHSRLRLVASAGNPKNAVGNVDAALRYLEVSTNLLDTWFGMGDSIGTAGAQAERNIGGRVSAIDSARQPLLEMLGWPGLGVEHISDTGTQRTSWLGYLTDTACRQAIITIGANNTAMTTAAFETKLKVACADLLNAGITPHLATIPYSPDATRNTAVQGLNGRISAIIAAYPTKVKAGPDLYAYFAANPTLISADNLHPTEPAGYNAWAQQVAAFIAAATPASTAPGTTL